MDISEVLPKVDILLAVYNGEKHLDELINSLINQDYPNFHIYVRDNHSTDRTVEILKIWQQRYPSKLTLYLSDKNDGIIRNFANLMEKSNSSYVMFCDADDIWFYDKVSYSILKMKELETIYGSSFPLLLHTDLIVTDENLNMIAPSFWKLSKLNTSEKCQELSRLLVQNHVTGCTMLMNRALINLCLPIPLECVMHDWWIALVASCYGKIQTLSSPTLLYRQHGLNDTGARRYGIMSYLRNKSKNSKDLKLKKTKQAELLLDRKTTNLSLEKEKIIKCYLAMQKACLPKRIFLLIKFRFFKSGFLRNFIFNH